jgi:hypothetical protein
MDTSSTPPETRYPPRIAAFRAALIRQIPRVPNNRLTLSRAQALPTHRLILAYVTWGMRIIPPKPRGIRIWGAVSPQEWVEARQDAAPFLQQVERGEDISAHLSEQVRTSGLIFPGARGAAKRANIDHYLVRYGLYHFHLGRRSAANPKARSGRLLFADVTDEEFRVVALSNHKAFDRGDPEHMRLFQIAHDYIGRDVPPGQGFMTNPVMTSGHAMNVVRFSDYCDDRMQALDVQLDDPAFVGQLYAKGNPFRDGLPIALPQRPKLKWHFHDLEFGILDEATGVFFCVSPFFKR